jgi:hypothetical protein
MTPGVLWLLAGLAVAIILFAATGGHLIFLPIFLILPLGFFGLGRRRR